MRIHLRPGERIYVNGAVLRLDRKASLEFLNDVTFLLESHVMQAEDATTPLRQLYFVVQMILIDPGSESETLAHFEGMLARLRAHLRSAEMRAGLAEVETLVRRSRHFEALKRLRALFAVEDAILARPVVPARPVTLEGAA